MKRIRVSALLAGCLLGTVVGGRAQGPAPESGDKYTWLEDVSGDRSMAWVKAENARTAAVLEHDPHYSGYFDQALAIGEDPHKLAFPGQRGTGEIYNTWRDKNNPRGLVRKTTTADYLTDTPHWTTVLDVDALGKAEGVGWVLKGFSCLYPGDEFCMVQLSVGGEDAVTMREFDLKTARFVPGGFLLPHSKESVSWLDKDTLLVERDWGAGSMTASGYPFVSKVWKRGTPLESAREIYRGQPTDVSAGGNVQQDAQGDKLVVFSRETDFFSTEYSVQTPQGIERLMIPGKANLAGLVSGRLLVEVREPWTPGAGQAAIPQGSLVQLQLADVMKDPAHLKPVVVFAPTADEFLEGVRTTHERLLVTTLAHVQGRAYVYTAAAKGGWNKLGKPVDRNEWNMTPPTVNAYFNSQMNDINFPAGVLQPPLYDVRLDDAPNYGNTGATIGHELTHAFDDSGRQFDAAGNLRDWWTPADAQGFEQRIECVRTQYAGYTIVDDIHIQSRLTSGEDVADLGGTLLAYIAWKKHTAAQQLTSQDGFTPDQRFFIGMAQWACENERPEQLRLKALTDPHSPGFARINGVVSNLPQFQQAFSCKAGQPLVHTPTCKVW